MERLEKKCIKGRDYYYYSKWERVQTPKGSACRRVWQKYLGTLETILNTMKSGGNVSPKHVEIFQWGLPMTLWQECCFTEIVGQVDRICKKREQGLTVGEYMAIAAINRAISPVSKSSMWDWFSQTALIRQIPNSSKEALSSQRFWDHMHKINDNNISTIWENIILNVIKKEKIDLSSVSYDGTNFYTFIDTFNTKCDIAKRGKNKQGRSNLRQVSYALFCTADGHIPLYYELYEGNRNDAKQFPLMIKKLNKLFNKINPNNTTVIFDKGNNSPCNIELLDSFTMKFVGSVKLVEHKELANISNTDSRFQDCSSIPGTKAFRVKKSVYGKERTLVVTFNKNLFECQLLTLNNDVNKAMESLRDLSNKLKDRIEGRVTKGKKPSETSLKRQCDEILRRQHLKKVIKYTINPGDIPTLEYRLDSEEYHNLSNTYLGKNILITSREEWSDEKIIQAYRSQFIIEDVFKEMKDRNRGEWWPLHHWTTQKLQVHGLYCTIAVLIRALALRRVQQSGIQISLNRMLKELDGIREVVNIYPAKNQRKKETTSSVLSKYSEIQEKLMKSLGLELRKTLNNQELG